MQHRQPRHNHNEIYNSLCHVQFQRNHDNDKLIYTKSIPRHHDSSKLVHKHLLDKRDDKHTRNTVSNEAIT